jgi:hypothetical protein
MEPIISEKASARLTKQNLECTVHEVIGKVEEGDDEGMTIYQYIIRATLEGSEKNVNLGKREILKRSTSHVVSRRKIATYPYMY